MIRDKNIEKMDMKLILYSIKIICD